MARVLTSNLKLNGFRMRLILLILSLLVFLQANANDAMTWEECARYALDHNLNLKQYQINLEEQNLQVANTRQRYLPSINGYANYTENFGRSIDPQTNAISNTEFYASNYGIRASVGLFEGFMRHHRLRYEKMIMESETAHFEQQKKTLLFNVIEQFTTVKLYEGLVKITEEEVLLSQRFLDRYIKLIIVGQKSELSIVDIKAKLAQDSVRLVQTEMNLELEKNTLKRLMNYDLDKELVLKDVDFNPNSLDNTSYSSLELMSLAQKHLPEIKEIQKQIEASHLLIKEEQGRILPSIYLNTGVSSAFYETTNNNQGNTMSFVNQFDGNLGSYVSLHLNIPIFNRLHSRNRIRLAKLEQEKKQVYYEEFLQDIRYELNENNLLLEASFQSYKYGLSSEEKQQTAFITAEKRLENGLINILDFYTYKNAYAFAKSERIRLGLELFLQNKIIDYYLTGNIIKN